MKVAVIALLFAVAAFALSNEVELDSQADLKSAAEIALLAEQGDDPNGIWYVRVFNQPPAAADSNTGPFSYAGLDPVPKDGGAAAAAAAATARKQAARAARAQRREVRKAMAAMKPKANATMLPATILAPPAPNPLLPVKDSTLVVPIDDAQRALMSKVTIIGIPDKATQPELWKEWRSQQDSFGYLGLHPVKPHVRRRHHRKGKGKGKTGKRRAPRGPLAPVKVIGKEYVGGTVPTIAPEDKATYTLAPVIMPGIVAPPPPPPAPAAVAPAPAAATVSAPNPPMPVPGATAFLEVEDSITPYTYEETENLAAAERADAWSTLNSGMADMFYEAADAHRNNLQQMHQMGADLASALQVEEGSPTHAFLISIAESTEPMAQYGEVADHQSIAAEHGIAKEFKLVRSSRVLSNAIDSLDHEHVQHMANLEHKIALIEESMKEAGTDIVNTQTKGDYPFTVSVQPADATYSPAVTAYAPQFSAPRIDTSNITWARIQSYPYTPFEALDAQLNPHPPVMRVISDAMLNMRKHFKRYHHHRADSVGHLASKVQKLMHQLGKATIAERDLVARALGMRVHRRRHRRAHQKAKAAERKLKKLSHKMKKGLKSIGDIKKLKKAVSANPAAKKIAKKALKLEHAAKKAVEAAKKAGAEAAKAAAAAKAAPKDDKLAKAATAALKKHKELEKAATAALKAAKDEAEAVKKLASGDKKAAKKALKKAKKAKKQMKKAAKKAKKAGKKVKKAKNGASADCTALKARVDKLEALVKELSKKKSPTEVQSAKKIAHLKAMLHKEHKKAKKEHKKAVKAKKAAKKAKKTAKKANKKAKKAKKAAKKAKKVAADPAAACAKAAAVAAECTKQKDTTSKKCKHAQKAIATPICTKKAAAKVALLAVDAEADTELLSEQDKATLASALVEVSSEVEELESDPVNDLEAPSPSPVDDASLDEDATESATLTADIQSLAGAALAEEVAAVQKAEAQKATQAEYKMDLGALPAIPEFRSNDKPTDSLSSQSSENSEGITVKDTMSQIAAALDEQNAI